MVGVPRSQAPVESGCSFAECQEGCEVVDKLVVATPPCTPPLRPRLPSLSKRPDGLSPALLPLSDSNIKEIVLEADDAVVYPPNFSEIVEQYGARQVSRSVEWRAVINSAVEDIDTEVAFFVVDLSVPVRQLAEWKRALPRVQPYYQIMCNPDPAVVALLRTMGCKISCSNRGEIEAARKLGCEGHDVLYTGGLKVASHLAWAREQGVQLVSLTSLSELPSLVENHPTASYVLAVSAGASSDQTKISLDSAVSVAVAARDAGLKVVGLSLVLASHMTPLQTDHSSSPTEGHHEANANAPHPPPAYHHLIQAIPRVRGIFDELHHQHGMALTLLDIGHTLPWRDSPIIQVNAGEYGSFGPFAADLKSSLDEHFPESFGVNLIAQPSRMLLSPSHTLVVNVFGRRQIKEKDGTSRFLYYVNDGLYGSFGCLVFDRDEHVTVSPMRVSPSHSPKSSLAPESAEVMYPCTIFGPTCDSLDNIYQGVLPELQVGEWLYFLEMGSYTKAFTTSFNGFLAPNVYYVYTH
eukprot:TRINITY_DN2559_c0_g2::TRINITY_DN2559_c0_g2_i1::g.19436::m.19436 TRINITY_DN2559_c0_g2::TRINITY_DN2559_c0_g2_i1::g.19436  ORF type:complete len:522 (+),score=109.31,sp/P07805/DCOR_TRYBB/32.37/9e-65,Orn_DAP_Arg_deC/PF00278.17/4.3e-24,Orn_Arg_deC_N/PF02784.11/2e-18,Orn_Arg_deC_N/PF02784.11/0.0072 TRINITY_DN2559_c0_g2_i1:65-1630(+)